MALQCGKCYQKFTPDAYGGMPPWCSHCGADLKKYAVDTMAQMAPEVAAVARATAKYEPGETSRMLDALVVGQPLERAYRHVGCGHVTLVSGDDYVLLECPFRPVTETFCAGCQQYVYLNEVRWVDSDQKICDYRDQVKASVPFWKRIWLSVFCNAYQGAVNLHLDSRGRRLPTHNNS